MTNPDQDVTLDETNDELRKMAKSIVRWMDDRRLISNLIGGPLSWEYNDIRNGSTGRKLEYYWTSLDVIREVEEAIIENDAKTGGELWKIYLQKLSRVVYETDFHIDCYTKEISGELNETKFWYLITADPKTRLRAIYRTLRESGEI